MKHVDLTRVQAAEQSIVEVLRRRPDLGDRTSRYLAGNLEEAEMTEQTGPGRIARIPDDIGERVERLRLAMIQAGAPELAAAARPSWTAVIRLSLTLGLEQLEERYGPKKTEADKKRKS